MISSLFSKHFFIFQQILCTGISESLIHCHSDTSVSKFTLIAVHTIKRCLNYNVFPSFKVWHWSDSPENQFSPLNSGSGIQNCALMLQSNGMFKQDNCILHYPYVCEVQSGTSGFFGDSSCYTMLNKCILTFFFLNIFIAN